MDVTRIAAVTGTRADFGLLRGILDELEADPSFSLSVLVTGMHLSPEFGFTVEEVESAGFTDVRRVETLLSSDSAVGVAKSMGLVLIGFADALLSVEPHLLLALGDRFETFAAAQAALMQGIPIAHIHGGETSEGSLDEAMRHSLTKMAHLHFVTTENHRRRVIQLGEAPERVFNVGAPGTDAPERLRSWSRAELAEALGCALEPPLILVAHHPETARSQEESVGGARAVVEALEGLEEATVVVTGANADAGGRAVNEVLRTFVARADSRRRFVMNLGQERYLSLLRVADVVVGNSSSALIEAPVVETPAVNVGDRQRGRDRGPSVIDAAPTPDQVRDALRLALDPDFVSRIDWAASPYGRGGVAGRVHGVLSSVRPSGLGAKRFYDLDFRVQ